MPFQYPFSSIHDRFSRQALLTPDNRAILYKDTSLSYQQLETRSSALAVRLLKAGVLPADPVAILCERTPDMIISMLAILKAGGAYLPIDITYPAERISFILKDTAPLAVLTTSFLNPALPSTVPRSAIILLDHINDDHEDIKPILPPISCDAPAYILFSSGTTGRPKGIVVPHRGVVRLVTDQNYFRFGASRTFLQLASPSFDAATWEIWGPLLNGGTCVLYPGDNLPEPAILRGLIVRHSISTLLLTTTLFHTLIAFEPDCLRGIAEIMTGGEVLSPSCVRKALKALPGVTLINAYGPTENSVCTTCYRIPRDLPDNWLSIPIGRAINHTTTYIFNDKLEPVPAGETGELYTGGAGVALGYLNRPDLTAAKFIVNPDPNAPDRLLYRTGDLVRLLPDDLIDFVGRVDDQVKIRGFRVELGEITARLLDCEEIKQAACVVHTDVDGNKRIVAYIVREKAICSHDALRGFLAETLADYMIPACFIDLEQLPLNANGKLDISKLPVPQFSVPRKNFTEPSTDMEKKLAILWSRLLHAESVSVTDNFFEVGGTSLLSLQMAVAMNTNFDLPATVHVVDIYQYPTIRTLAAQVTKKTIKAEVAQDLCTGRAQQQRNAFTKFKKSR